ncbi:MAG: helix-turn-helix domain-containing protein [Chloroflexota bacterium]|nr:helix-turn-helix domain-containing protein [Chloroflexota bacterium]
MTTPPKQLQWIKRVQVPARFPVETPTPRERLVAALAGRPRTVAQLANDFGLSQPTMLDQVRRALRDGLIVEVEVLPEQRRTAGERYYAPTVPVIRQADRELLEPACRALANEMATALAGQRGDLLAAFAMTHLARDGWEFSDLWPFIQEIVFRLTLEQMDGLIAPTAVARHGLAWVEELVDAELTVVDEHEEEIA